MRPLTLCLAAVAVGVAGAALTANAADWPTFHQNTALTGVTTDADGKAHFRFTPSMQGSYRIEGQARDRRGNQIPGPRVLQPIYIDGDQIRCLPHLQRADILPT